MRGVRHVCLSLHHKMATDTFAKRLCKHHSLNCKLLNSLDDYVYYVDDVRLNDCNNHTCYGFIFANLS